MAPKSFLAVLSALLAVVSADGLYPKSSAVLQVDGKSYESLIANSNHTSIVEFYAPWCGHCKSLQPAYEKAAKNLAGLAKVAAVNCDDESNKQFCSSMGVQGFPTLKIVRPSAKSGKPVVEDYQGPRTAKGIVDAVVEKIPNHVKRVNDNNLDEWLAQGNDSTKAILFTEKGTTSALFRALAVDFLSSISFAQIRSKETTAVEIFGIEKFPTMVVLPGGDKESLVYEGDMKKDGMVTFLSQIASPNPDPAPKKAKASPSKTSKAAKFSSSSVSSTFSEASESQKAAEASEAAASASSMTVEDPVPTESPEPIVYPEETPIQLPDVAPPLPELATPGALAQTCLGEKTGTCVLTLLPPISDVESTLPDSANAALLSLSELAAKHKKRQAHLFPIYSVPGNNEEAVTLRQNLGLTNSEVQVVAINGKRGWWRHYSSELFDLMDVENWIDAIRLGEGQKERLPEGVIIKAKVEEVEHDEL